MNRIKNIMSTPNITAIVAATKSNGIGLNGGLPWRLPGEMKYFAKGKPLCHRCWPYILSTELFQGCPVALSAIQVSCDKANQDRKGLMSRTEQGLMIE